MNKVYLNVGFKADELAFALNQLDNDSIFELIKAVDDLVGEYEFTERLAQHFQSVLDKENEA